MQLDNLVKLYAKHQLPEKSLKIAMQALNNLNEMVANNVDDVSADDLDQFIASRVIKGSLEPEFFYGLMRYFYMIKRSDLYIHLSQYTGSIGVISCIYDRLEIVKNRHIREIVEQTNPIPKLGTHPKVLAAFTAHLMDVLNAELITERELQLVLSGNNHQIPNEVFLAEKAAYEASVSLTAYLEDYHKRQIEILSKHAKTGEPWFEQTITTEVVDYVKSNPEIQGGIYKDGFIYETKIPYDIVKWLHAKTPETKRYYTCHCPFARESILSKQHQIDPLWCHCSGGFAKKKYEVIFGQPLKAKPLENALKGDDYCRFAVDVRHISNLK